MTTMVIERDKLAELVKRWASSVGEESGVKFEVFLLPGEMIIRPQPSERGELDEWLDKTTKKYHNLLKRLAES